MNQVTIVVYPPGAYGSFISWMIERFSKHRTGITDDPLLPDGSSHGYASFCKVKGIDDFMAGLEEARHDTKPWHTNIYAGWPSNPSEDLDSNIKNILEWMMPFDKLIYVDVARADEHILCYLRNEATMDRDRWYGMLGIDSDDQLADRLRIDIESHGLSGINDPRLTWLNIEDILDEHSGVLWHKMCQALGWPMKDNKLYVNVSSEMRRKQQKFYQLLAEGFKSEGTPVQRAAWKYFKDKNNGSN